MRIPDYLSPSNLKTWESDRREYYLRYLCEVRSPKIAQTHQMALGSAFDGLIKNEIERLMGLPIVDYGKQVEVQNADAAWSKGKEVYDYYVKSGGIKLLMLSGKPRMEFSVKGTVGGVPLLGKPDLYYKSPSGVRIVHDWKVNGFFSKASPQQGYLWDSKTGLPHKNQIVSKCLDVLIGGDDTLFNREWLDQEITYGWLLGEPVGEEFVCQVHQLTHMSGVARLTHHATLANPDYQRKLLVRYQGCWEAIKNGRCFTDMSEEDDKKEQKSLDNIAAGLVAGKDDGFNSLVGR